VLEAAVTHQLLDEVDLALEVGAVRRRLAAPGLRVVVVDRDLEAAEDPVGLGVGDRHAEEGLGAGRTEVDRRASGALADGLGVAGAAGAGQVLEHVHRAQGGAAEAGAVVDAAFEPVRRVGGEAVAAGGRADAPRGEPRGLEQQLARPGGDHGVGAAHHAGEGLRAGRVGDHEVLRVEGEDAAVEGGERLGRGGEADDHPALRELVAVERVERLARLEQDVVGDVDDVGDRAQAESVQAHAQPQRRRADGRVLEHVADVAAAAVGGGDRDELGARAQAEGVDPADRREAQGAAQLGGDVAGDADVAERVGAVGGDGELEDRVPGALDEGGERGARGERRREDEDPAVVGADVELDLRADHAVRGDAAELAGGDLEAVGQAGADRGERHLAAGGRDVRRAAHDLDGGLAVPQFDDAELAGLRVRGDRADLGGDHRRQAVALALQRLDLEAEAGEDRRELGRRRRGAREIEETRQPRMRDQHGNCSRKRTSPSNIRRRCGT
jgi:hypothetical protein